MIGLIPLTFREEVAAKALHLCIQRNVLLSTTGIVFYIWQRDDRLIIAFDPDVIDTARVNDDFAHRLSTRLQGRLVLRTNSRGMFLQVDPEIPPAPQPLETRLLDLSFQPTPWHVPVGMTTDGPLWIPFLEGDSFLIGGSRNGGKTGEEHGWIQALLHGARTVIYAWDGKRGAEFGRYVGRPNFRLLLNGVKGLEELQNVLREREKLLAASGYPNIVMHNDAEQEFIPPIALFVDEAADLPAQAKDLLKSMIQLNRYLGLYPIIATNQPTVADVFAKTNLSTRVAFRVPHHNDSVTILGYKGAEALPDIRGRGLIVWKGKFVEFQSFQVVYPMPSDAQRQLISEQLATEHAPTNAEPPTKSDPDIERILHLYSDGVSPTNIVYKIWGTSGTYFAERMAKVKEILATAATAAASKSPDLPLEGAAG